MPYAIKAIDCVVNPITPEIMRLRPAWSRAFWEGKFGRDESVADGVSHEQMLALMDAAGIERAMLVATKTGQLGIPGSWHLPYSIVADAVQRYPDRFSGLAGLDPTEGMAGVRAFEHAVREYGFIGAHFYPHWFEMAPDAWNSTCRCNCRSGSRWSTTRLARCAAWVVRSHWTRWPAISRS